MASREDIEQIDVDEVADSPATRSMLIMLKTMLLELMTLLEQLRMDLKERDAAVKERDAENAELRRALFGQKSERQPRTRGPKPPPEPEEEQRRYAEGQRRRQRTRAQKAELPTEEVPHPAPEHCPGCRGEGPFSHLPPDVSWSYEVVPARLVRHRHIREVRRCGCGQIFSGPAPRRVGECAHYGPGLHADAVVSKCADALPLNRLAKRYARSGVPMHRSTLTDLFHRTAGLVMPLYQRLSAIVAAAVYVNADETSQPVMDTEKCRTGFMWTFIADQIVLYRFSPSRSGETPNTLLGDSTGVLQVDGYTGYNHVTTPERRVRAGCLAHARRYFHKARDNCPAEADYVFDLVRRLYRVEREAARRGIIGTPTHQALRKHQSAPLMQAWRSWLEEQEPRHVPKSPMGKAIRYTKNQWKPLTRFLTDPKIPLDNNVSERALRVIALGRDNFRWVGSDQAGENLAVLQTIVATCIASDVDPQAYLTDVLVRINEHPASALDDLLPMNWSPAELE